MKYKITTKKSWSGTMNDLANEFRMWNISSNDWDVNYPKGARLEGFKQSETDRTVILDYKKDDKNIRLVMGAQARAVDNLRVLFLAIESMRLNEKRGIGELLKSAYLQIAGPVRQRNPWEVLAIFPGSPLPIAEAAYKVKAITAHPDSGGSEEQMKELNEAIEKVRKGLA